jgi:transcriptional regulator with XRE-family HTH domain
MQSFFLVSPSKDLGVIVLAEPFGVWMRRTRTEKGLTLEEVAELTGARYPTIQRYETGIRNVPFDQALLIADAFGESRAKVAAIWVAACSGEELTREPDEELREVIELYEGIEQPINKSVARDMLKTLRDSERRYSIGGGMEPTVEPPERDRPTGTK